MSTVKKFDIGVAGAGHAGVPMAAMAAKAGLKVGLYADPKHRGSNFSHLMKEALKDGRQFDEAIISSDGVIKGEFNVTLIFEMQTMVNDCEQIWNNLPEFAHQQFVDELAACDNMETVAIGTITANGFSSKARNRIHPRCFIDCAVSPTASRAVKGRAFVAGVKEGMYVGLFPHDTPHSVLDIYKKIYPEQKIEMLKNAFGALFANTNLWVHPGPLLLAAVALLMGTPGLKFYPHCFGGRIGARVAKNAAHYLCLLAKEYDYEIREGVKLSKFYYNFPAKDIEDFAARLPAYNAQPFLPPAETLETNRYMTEDPAVLNMCATLAQLASVSPRPFHAVVDMVGMAVQDDWEEVVDDLSGLDLKGLTKEQIIAAAHEKKADWDARWANGLEESRKWSAGQKSSGKTIHDHFEEHANDPEMRAKWKSFLESQ